MKKFAVMILTVFVLFALAACGESTLYTPAPASTPEPGLIETESPDTAATSEEPKSGYTRLTQAEWHGHTGHGFFLTDAEQGDRLLLKGVLVRFFLTSEELEAARDGIEINGEEFIFTDGSQPFPYDTQVIGYLRNVRTGDISIGIVPTQIYGDVSVYALFCLSDFSSSVWIMTDMHRKIEINKDTLFFVSIYAGSFPIEANAIDIFSDFTPQGVIDGLLIDGILHAVFDDNEVIQGHFFQRGIRFESSR